MIDYREKWKGWKLLPHQNKLEGNTGRYPNYQKIIHSVVKELKPKTVVEIGFNAGHSACCILDASPDNIMFYTFDIVRHGYENNAFNVLKNIYNNILLIEGPSKDTVLSFLEKNNINIDFAFVDACHGGGKNLCCKNLPTSERCPFIDIENCKKYMNIGGIIFVDDMGVADVTPCFNKVDWKDYEDLTYTKKGMSSEKSFKIMKKIK